MFHTFFYSLRASKVPVSTTELLDLITAVEKYSERQGSLTIKEFYSIARSCLVKDVKHYDSYDLVFGKIFGDLGVGDEEFRKLLEEWLGKVADLEITEGKKKNAMNLSPEELFKELEKRLKEQKEKHDGGNYWIGTSGTSAFGNSGFNPAGVRIGESSNQGRSAIQVLSDRKYREYRTDESLNVR
ncbi:MAG: VWA containing CoxE family protein, partial [Leptospiraceae bacterium]|nr:VWA containing CoxE family protein [Leptospiraceae bacterium]